MVTGLSPPLVVAVVVVFGCGPVEAPALPASMAATAGRSAMAAAMVVITDRMSAISAASAVSLVRVIGAAALLLDSLTSAASSKSSTVCGRIIMTSFFVSARRPWIIPSTTIRPPSIPSRRASRALASM